MARTGMGLARSGTPALITIAIQAIASLVNLIVTWYLIRAIGVAGFGYYALYFLLCTAIVTVAGDYIIQPLNSLGSQLSDGRAEQFIRSARTSNALVVAGLFALGLAAMGMSWAMGASVRHAGAITAYAVAMSLGEFHRRVQFFRGRRLDVLGYDLLRYALMAGAAGLIASRVPQADAATYVVAFSVTYLLALLPRAVAPRRHAQASISAPRNKAQMRRIHRSGRHLAAGSAMRLIGTQVPIYIGFFLMGAHEAGLIRVAQTIVNVLNPVTQALEHVIPVWLGRRIRRQGLEPALRVYRKMAMLVLAALFLLYCLLNLASPLIHRLLGVDHGPVAQWLVAGFSLTTLLVVAQTLFLFEMRAKERASVMSQALMASAVFALAASYPAVTWQGPLGVVLVIAGAQAMGLAFMARSNPSLRGGTSLPSPPVARRAPGRPFRAPGVPVPATQPRQTPPMFYGAIDRIRLTMRDVALAASGLPNALNDRSDKPLVLCNSFPKSGTHLLSQILTQFPSVRPWDDIISVQALSGVMNTRQHIRWKLASVPPGSLVRAHLMHVPEVIEVLSQFEVRSFFIMRDLRDVAVSHARWVLGEPRIFLHAIYKAMDSFDDCLMASIRGVPLGTPFGSNASQPDIGTDFRRWAGWLTDPGTLTVRFEDLVGERGGGDEAARIGRVRAVAEHLGYPLDEAAAARHFGSRVLDPSTSPTFRKGEIGGWSDIFNERHREAFRYVAGDLLVELGYERDLDW